MNKCLGHPFCEVLVDPPNLLCHRCYLKLTVKLRNLVKALVYRSVSDKTRKEILDETLSLLHSKLEKEMTRKVEIAKYTVVPHKGKRVRKTPKPKYKQAMKQKYYGGPWDYQN